MSTVTSPTETLTELLTHLVRMPTISSDQATNAAALDWIQQQLQDLPLHVKRLERGGFASLIATTRPTRNPKLWLAAHIDVVPAEPELFKANVADGRLVGRGAYDMKSAIAVFIRLLQELGPNLSNYDLGLMLTADEEVGGDNGVGWLISQGYRGEAVLLPDSLRSWMIEYGAKGASFWRFTSHGHAAHGSRTWLGDNAIERLNKFIDVLRTNTVAEPCGDSAHIHHTLNLGQLQGGIVINQVPESAEALVDIRIQPGTSLEEINTWISKAQAAVPDVAAEALPMQIDPYRLITTGPVELFAALAEEVIGRPLPRILAHGGTDARWFAKHNVPVITVSPNGGEPHTPKEWVDLEDLERFYNVTHRFVDQWAKVDSSK